MKVVVQVALLPAASVAVTVIRCAPRPTIVPAAGAWLKVIALGPLQLSLTVTLANTSGTGAWQVPSALATGIAEQLTFGWLESLTVKVVVQVALLPAASVAVTVIRCVPRPTTVPAAGSWLKAIALGPLQLSLTVTLANTSGTAAWQFPSALAAGVTEQLTLGCVVSLTVKVVVQVALLPASSIALTVIMCVPRPTTVPAGGTWLKMIALSPLQLSLTVTLASTSGTGAWQVPSALAGGVTERLTLGSRVSPTVYVV